MKLKNDFSKALLKEIVLQKNYLAKEPVHTIYFGGGTPSLLSENELRSTLDALRQEYNLVPAAEITLEANPDDIDREKLAGWKRAGINRLSIGIQSFFDEDLRWMNRAHNAGQALQSINLSREAGFDNLTIDLIYGGPTLPDDRWQQNVALAIRNGIPHLSCYALTVEPRTALDSMIRKKKYTAVSTDDQARQFLLLINWLEQAGYEQYEISNFALPGKRSLHNSAYWKGEKYLGLGPSAHSFDGGSRQWNVANNALYIESVSKNIVPFEKEILTGTQQLNEYIMTSLRTLEGVDMKWVQQKFGAAAERSLLASSRQYLEQQWLVATSNRLVLTTQGKLFADGIAAGLFAEE